MTSSTTSWAARLLAAVEVNKPQPLFFVLSTIGIDGSPRSRTVVCRRIEDHRGRLVICTATDSDKWAELKRDSRFEICWYFATTREQFRLRGASTEFFQRPSEEAERVWTGMSDTARAMFVNASSKDTFGVMAFKPNKVHLLELISGNVTEWNDH